MSFLPGLLLAQVLAGCGGGSSDASPVPQATGSSLPPVPPPPVPPPPAKLSHGRFVGTVKIAGQDYYGDALLTIDGAVRLYVGGPYASNGALQQTRPESSEQFVGNLQVNGDQAVGSGVIIGQGCAPPHDFVGLCGAKALGEIRIGIAVDSGDIQGEIQVEVNGAHSSWTVKLSPWRNYYVLPARLESVAGQYQEELAEFALARDTIVNVDRAGKLFFQSARSGCTGNGTLAPHLDGKFNVYDVTLTIESCNAPYVYLNGEFEGLAAMSPGSVWDYDSVLRIWLSRSDGALVAVTMLGW